MHIHGSQNAPRHFNYRSFYMTTHYSRCPAHSLSFDLYKNRPQAASMLAPFRLLESEDDRNEIRRNIRTHFSLNYTFLLFSLAFLKLKYNFFKPKCLHHDRGLGEETKDLKETKDTIFSAELEIALLVLPLQLIILSHFHHISVYRQAHLNNVPYRRKPPQMHISPTS